MSGFFGIKKSLLEKTDQKWLCIGYKLLLELLAKYNNIKICEIPIKFRYRLYGNTKLNKREILNYLLLLCRLYYKKFLSKLKK